MSWRAPSAKSLSAASRVHSSIGGREGNFRPGRRGVNFVDTNVLVRYLTGEPAKQADAAARLLDGEIEGEAALSITSTVLLETAYVLHTVYALPREAVVDALSELIQKRNIALYQMNQDVVLQGLALCRPSGRVSFGDALLWASVRSASHQDKATLYSFDQSFPTDGIDLKAEF